MNKNKFVPLILPIIIIIIWYIATSVLVLAPNYILPSPIEVCSSAWDLILSGELFVDVLDSLFKVFGGMLLASIIGIPLGILLGWYSKLENICSFVISVLRPIPPMAWIPFSVLWFGIGFVPAVFIIFMGCISPIFVYTIDGVKRIDKVLIEAAQTLGADDKTILADVILPSAVPPIVSGLKVGVGIALMCTISAEMIGSNSGLGYLIMSASSRYDPGTVVVGMLVIGLIGLILDYAFGLIEKKVFW